MSLSGHHACSWDSGHTQDGPGTSPWPEYLPSPAMLPSLRTCCRRHAAAEGRAHVPHLQCFGVRCTHFADAWWCQASSVAGLLSGSWHPGKDELSTLPLSDKKAEIDLLAAEYISTVKTLSAEQRVQHLQKIQSAYSKCKEYSDDKVQLAMQTYEMVRRRCGQLGLGGDASRGAQTGPWLRLVFVALLLIYLAGENIFFVSFFFLNPHPLRCSENGEAGREGEKHQLTASHAHPSQGANLQPSHVP